GGATRYPAQDLACGTIPGQRAGDGACRRLAVGEFHGADAGSTVIACGRHEFPGCRVARLAAHTRGLRGNVFASCAGRRLTGRRARGRHRDWREPDRLPDTLSSRDPAEWRAWWLPLGTRTQTGDAGVGTPTGARRVKRAYRSSSLR